MDERYDPFDSVYHIYSGTNGECASGSVGDDYGVLTGDGELIKMEGYIPAKIYAALRALYGDVPLVDDRQVVPIKIAVAGKPAIATYQYMAHYQYYDDFGTGYNSGKEEIADLVGVSDSTMKKYLRRIARQAMDIRIQGTLDRHHW